MASMARRPFKSMEMPVSTDWFETAAGTELLKGFPPGVGFYRGLGCLMQGPGGVEIRAVHLKATAGIVASVPILV